jgi:hypothetical protein
MSPEPTKPARPGLILAASLVAFLAGVLAVAVVLFLASAVTGFGDGDPPSDYLLTQQVYLPINAPSKDSGTRLQELVAAANKDGFEIRVAVIQSPQDLGSIPQLMGKPRTYAKFLGAEIAFAYKGRLLTVMSNGYGLSQNGGKPLPGGYAQIASIAPPGGSSPDTLTDAASAVVRQLAKANGHPLPQTLPSLDEASGTSFLSAHRTPLIAGGVVLVGVVLAGGVLLLSRRTN